MWYLHDPHLGVNHHILATQIQMRCKIQSFPPFRGKYGNKKETVTDTFVSITVSVMVAEAGLEPTTSGL